MDAKFREMLVEAERIRAVCRSIGDFGPHAAQNIKMINYSQEMRLITGDIFDGTASEEFLDHCTEIAACALEVGYGEEIGSILTLTREQKIAINRRAKKKAEMSLQFLEQHGRLPRRGELPGEG